MKVTNPTISEKQRKSTKATKIIGLVAGIVFAIYALIFLMTAIFYKEIEKDTVIAVYVMSAFFFGVSIGFFIMMAKAPQIVEKRFAKKRAKNPDFDKPKEKPAPIEKKKPEKQIVNDPIKSVEVIGTREGRETRVFATYNFTVYSLMVTFESGNRKVVECTADSETFNKLLPYIKPKD